MFIKGTHRYVIIVGSLVFKIPRVRILFWIKRVIVYDICKWKLSKPWVYLSWFTFEQLMFDGFMENYRETLCWHKTKHKLLAVLCLPLLFVNVYKREAAVGKFRFNHFELTRCIEASGNPDFLKAFCGTGHTFENMDNFAGNVGRIKILDYGGHNILELIRDYGDQLEEALRAVHDPSY